MFNRHSNQLRTNLRSFSEGSGFYYCFFRFFDKQNQNFGLSLKLLLEPRKAHVIPIVVFRDTFLFPRAATSDSGQRESPGEHPRTSSGSLLLSAVVGSVSKQWEHHTSKVRRSPPPKDTACLLALYLNIPAGGNTRALLFSWSSNSLSLLLAAVAPVVWGFLRALV